MKALILMIPFFLLSIGAAALVWTEKQPWVTIGYIVIALLFMGMFGAIVIFKEPSLEELERKKWRDFSILEKIKWKFTNGLRRNK